MDDKCSVDAAVKTSFKRPHGNS